MALIICPECCSEISSMAKYCIHCGFPINETINQQCAYNNRTNENMCLIDGANYNLSELIEYVLKSRGPKDPNPLDVACEWAKRIHGSSANGVLSLMIEIQKTGVIPETYNINQHTIKTPKDDGLVHCPRCDSTNIVTGQRGYSIVWGFVGSNRTMNRCAKCGHKWEPRR